MLEFPENYFRGEELEGFYVEEMMKRAWAAQKSSERNRTYLPEAGNYLFCRLWNTSWRGAP